MRWLLRPVMLLAISAALLVGGAVIVFQARPAPSRPTLAPVRDGEYEIAWLYPATNTAAWERFVAAVGRSGERLRADHPGLTAAIGPTAFPRQSNAIPEVALQWPGGRLLFRWYKLTSTWKTRDWVE